MSMLKYMRLYGYRVMQKKQIETTQSVTMPLSSFNRESKKVARNFESGKWHSVYITRSGHQHLVALSAKEHQRLLDVESRFEDALENCF